MFTIVKKGSLLTIFYKGLSFTIFNETPNLIKMVVIEKNVIDKYVFRHMKMIM